MAKGQQNNNKMVKKPKKDTSPTVKLSAAKRNLAETSEAPI